MSNRPKLKPRQPDASEIRFRDELRKGCPGCGSQVVTGRFLADAEHWEFTLRCAASCPSFTRPGFSGHTIGAAAAERAGMEYRPLAGTPGGVVVTARAGG